MDYRLLVIVSRLLLARGRYRASMRTWCAALLCAASMCAPRLAIAAPPAVTVLDVVPGAEGLAPTEPYLHGGAAFLGGTAGNVASLWRTNGTLVGTTAVKGLPAGQISRLGGVAGGFVFVVGERLFRSDGTAAGTVEVMTLPRPPPATTASYRLVGSTGKVAVFHRTTDVPVNTNTSVGTRVLRTDGTAGGTFELSTTISQPSYEPLSQPVVVDGYLYFHDSAFSGFFRTNGTGLERWLSAPNTYNAADRSAGLLACNGAAYYQSVQEFNRVSASGIVVLANLGGPRYGMAMGCTGTKLVFFGYDAVNGREPWVTDGTPAGTFLLKDILPGSGSGVEARSSGHLVSVNGRVVFAATAVDGATPEVWTTDGTPAGTVKLAAVDGTSLRGIGAIGSRAYLYGGLAPQSVYVTNGSALTVVPLVAAVAGPDTFPLRSVTLGSRLIYRTTTPTSGPEPWVLDDPDALAVPPDGGVPDGGASSSSGGATSSGGASSSSGASSKGLAEGPGAESSSSGCAAASGRPAGGRFAVGGVACLLLGLRRRGRPRFSKRAIGAIAPREPHDFRASRTSKPGGSLPGAEVAWQRAWCTPRRR